MDTRSIKSLPRLFLELFFELGWIALIIVIPVFAPLALGLSGWMAYLPIAWLTNRIRGGVPYRLQQFNFFWTLGLAIGIGRAIPTFWIAFCAGVLVIFGGILLISHLEKRLGLNLEKQVASESDNDLMPLPTPYSARGASAWGGGEPRLTPEGEPVRLLGESEIAMGGPVVCDYLLPDGSVIFNGNPSAQFSSDGRYFVSPAPSRNEWSLLIYDRKQRVLHHCGVSQFWELDHVSSTEVIGRVSPLTSDAPYRANIDELIAGANRVDTFVGIQDLWLPDSYWQYLQPDHQNRTLPSPPQAPTLELRTCLPERLMDLGDPLEPLRNPLGELILDGQATGLMLMQPDPSLVFSRDGQTFVCAASRDDVSGFWLWQRSSGWRLMSNTWQPKEREPLCSSPNFIGLETEHLRLRMNWAQPCLEYRDHGPITSYTHGQIELVTGHTSRGKPKHGYAEMPEVDLLLPLNDAPLLLQSAPLKNGDRLTWEALRTSREGDLRAYQCSIGDWQLPGEWALDHRVSDCGHFIALIAFAEAPAVLHRVAIAEPRSETLHWLKDDVLDVHFQGFIDGQLHLLRLLGRNRYVPITGPGQGDPERESRFTEAAPAAGKAHEFAQRDGKWRLYYRQQVAVMEAGGWRLQELPEVKVQG